MEYMSVKEAARKWKISERYVQRYCTEGRIDGATRLGRAWAIPADAQKPEDRRQRKAEQEGTNQEEAAQEEQEADREDVREELPQETGTDEVNQQPHMLMPLLCMPYPPGAALQTVTAIEDADTRNIALGEYYYFTGRSAMASDVVEKYLIHKDVALRLSACLIYAYANLALDRIPRSRQALQQIRTAPHMVDENTTVLERAYVVCAAAGANVMLHLPMPEDIPPIRRCISMLPAGLRLFALYLQAHSAYLEGHYGTCIGIAETALSLEEEIYPISSIYLHLAAVMGYINLRQSDRAREHFLEAWRLAYPDDMIEAFGEHHGLLGGMIEVVLRKDYPNDFKRITDITYSFSAGWRKIHNSDMGHHVADDLTTMEFTIAMLAAKGWSNKEISAHLDISVNTVKMYVSSVLQQLNVAQRKDLVAYMLK